MMKNDWSQKQSLASNELDVSDVVEKVNPAVVSIIVTKDVPIMERYFIRPFGDSGHMGGMGLQIPQYRQNGSKTQEIGGGSGFIISSDGYVVSNAHVVRDPLSKYTVSLTGGKKYEATVVALDDVLDIALLKINEINLPFLSFGDSSQLRLGQSVVAIGNALGEFRNTVSTGIVSGLSRSITARDGRNTENLDNLIQTDAAINPGNSGGPLIDLYGKVIGVNVAVAGNSQNIGFAIPVNLIQDSLESMKINGRVIRPFMGIRYIPVTPELQETNKLAVDHGVLIVKGSTPSELAVIPGSPANKAGIVEYDILLSVDGVKIDSENPLPKTLKSKSVGDQITITILRGGEQKDVLLTLEEAK